MQNKKTKIFSIVLSVLVSAMLVSGAVMAATTIGTNITTAGNLTINTDKFVVTGSTGVVTLANGETIDNTTNGLINIAGDVTITPVYRSATDTLGLLKVDATDKLLGTTTRTYGLYVYASRPDGTNMTAGQADAGIRVQAQNNEDVAQNNYVLRSIEGLARNGSDTVAGKLGTLEGAAFGALGKVAATTGIIRGMTVTAENYGTAGSEFGGMDLILRNEAAVATAEYGLRIRNTNNSLGTAVTDAILIADSGLNIGFTYGLDMNGATIGTADLRLQNGETIDNVTDGTITFNGNYSTAGAKLLSTITEASAAVNGTKYNNFVVNASVDPAASGEVSALNAEYNWSAGTNGTFVVNGVQGVVRSRGADESGTFRGGYFRTYTDNEGYTGATARSSFGIETSVRTATDNVAEAGTAFVGERIYMAPYFSAGSVDNVNNFWGLWIYGEHATQRNGDAAIKISTAGGGFTKDLVLQYGETIDNATDSVIKFTSPALTHAFDAAAYWTATQADAGGVTFDSTSDGTPGFTFNATSAASNRYPVTFNITNTVANKVQGFYVNISQTTAANTDTIEGGLIVATNSYDGNAKDITGLEVKARGRQSLAASGTDITGILRGIYVSSDAKDQDPVTQRGIEVSLDGEGYVGNSTATMLQGLYIANNRGDATVQTEAYGIYLAGGDKGFTADIRLSSGATIISGSKANPNDATTVPCDVLGSLYTSTADGSLWSCTNVAADTWTSR